MLYVLVQKLAVFFAGEVLKLFGDPLDPLGYGAGRLVSDLPGDFFLGIPGGTKLEDFQIGLAQTPFEILHLHFIQNDSFKSRAGIGDVVELFAADRRAGLLYFLQRKRRCGPAVCPGAHEIPVLTAFPVVILRLTGLPYLVKHRLPVLLLHNQIGKIADQIAELLITEPGNFMVRRGYIQILKTPVQLRLKLFPEVYDGEVGHSPEGEVAGIVLPVAWDILIFAALFRDLEELPRRPGIAVPHKFQKAVALDQGA